MAGEQRPLWTRLLTLDTHLPHLPQIAFPQWETMGMAKPPSQTDLSPEPPTTGTLLVYGSTLRTCVVCLEDYRHGDRLRVLEPCTHTFHAKCVDDYFKACSAAVCPFCKRVVARPRFDVKENVERPLQRWTETEINVRWENVGLIDDGYQGWFEWFTNLVRAYSNDNPRDVG